MFIVPQGKTSFILPVAIKDTSSTTGAYKTGLTNGSVTIAYSRPDQGNAGATAVTLSSGTRGTWSSGGFAEKDSTNDKGLYEFGVPNAALAAGADWVEFSVQDAGSNNVAPQKILVLLSDAIRGVGAPTALPNAAAGANGGLPALDSNLRVASNLSAVNGDATAAANLAKTTRAIGRGTVGASATTTSIPTSALTPSDSVASQFKGKIITFDADTTTPALRSQSTDITATNGSGTLTVTALTTAPASGDTFSIT